MPGTPTQKFTTTTSGPTNQKPVAILAVTRIDALIGSIIQLDGRKSYDPEKQNLSWKWKFNQIPLGSEVETAGFRDIRPHGSAVSFIPDKVGIYVIELVVNDGELDSDPITATVSIQISRVPCGENIVPDAKFLWNYISNFWGLVEDREVITSIWSSTIQAIGAELIKLWSADNNKSLATIQGTFQRRWVPFSPITDVSGEIDQRIIVGKNDSGTGGRTGNIGQEPGEEYTQVFYLPKGAVGDLTASDFTNLEGNYGAKGRVIIINGECYTIQRVSNEDLLLAGNNDGVTAAGLSTFTSALATFIQAGIIEGDKVIIDGGADAGEYLVHDVYAEDGMALEKLDGTLAVFTGSSSVVYRVVRQFTVAVVDEEAIPDGQIGVTWRIPNLIHIPSVDFEDAGVRAGDVVVFEVSRGDLGLSTELRAQVVGVDRSRLGFELTLDDEISSGEVIDRGLMRQLIQDLKIVPPDSTQSLINAATEAIISFIPVSLNLAQSPFTRDRLTFKVKRIIHNKVIPFDDYLVSVPALQEQLKDPPVILRENLDYIVENGSVEFVSGLFTPSDPAPDQLWAECAILDNSGVIEENFGRLVLLSKDDLTARQTRVPYLSAVKGLFFAYTNGPTVANIRLGLQILLGLPFTEEQGVILEIQENFTQDTRGIDLGRILIEDLDDNGRRTGFRRIYFYPMVVGLEDNPVTLQPYVIGDTVERFRPLSKGVEVKDYIKDPYWWIRALYGLEVLKFFTFKISIDGDIFDSNDVKFAFDFVKAIKPAYTKVISTAVLSLSDDIEEDDAIGGAAVLKFYDNDWGLEATNKASDDNQQGFILFQAGSKPFQTRTLHLLKDVETYQDGPSVKASSIDGWSTDVVRARSVSGTPVVEGDILAILQGQPGASSVAPGLYEIGDVIDEHTLELLQLAPAVDPTTFQINPLDPGLFEYGAGLQCVIVRRGSNPIIRGDDLETNDSDSLVVSATAFFMTNAVSIGDYLVIESGPNQGEYFIDHVYPFTAGHPTLPPRITETQVTLKAADGSSPIFSASTGQSYRVVRRDSQAPIVYGAQSVYTGGQMELQVLDPNTGDPFDIFTPGMVGVIVEIANSENPINDGPQLITEYLNSGRVVLGASVSTTSDASAQAIIHFK
jgi:hypothetical protein